MTTMLLVPGREGVRVFGRQPRGHDGGRENPPHFSFFLILKGRTFRRLVHGENKGSRVMHHTEMLYWVRQECEHTLEGYGLRDDDVSFLGLKQVWEPACVWWSPLITYNVCLSSAARLSRVTRGSAAPIDNRSRGVNRSATNDLLR
jgi:hypothetical protein